MQGMRMVMKIAAWIMIVIPMRVVSIVIAIAVITITTAIAVVTVGIGKRKT